MNGSSHERKNGTSEEWEPQGSFSVWRARLETFSGLKPREIDFCRGFRRFHEMGGWKSSQVLNYVERAVGQPLDIRLDTTPKTSAIRHSWQPTTSSCLPSAPP